MALPEQEAKGKWCPFTRVGVASGDAGVAVNRYPVASTIHDETRCITSECMMWRWVGWQTKEFGIAQNPHENDRVGDRLGCCGLTGELNA